MKQSIAFLMIITIFLVGCTYQSQESISTDEELEVELKTTIMQSDFWKLIYIGRYSFPTETYEVAQNDRIYKSFVIEYSQISQDFIDVCNIDFVDFIEYAPNVCFANLPYNSIQELKDNIESVYTTECAYDILYKFYDVDYIEYDNTILRAFDSDTVLGYTIDYETLEVTQYTQNQITAVVKAYRHIDNSELEISYEFIFDNNIWKINSIKDIN